MKARMFRMRLAILACAMVTATQQRIAAAAPPAGPAVDTCAMLTEAEAVTLLGKLAQPPRVVHPDRYQLGGCIFTGLKFAAKVTALPPGKLDDTVRGDTTAKAIAGLGQKAFQTQYGVIFQPAGKPYCLLVFAAHVAVYDPGVSEAVA